MLARLCLLVLLAAPCSAQFGRRNQQQAAAGAATGGAADVDMAMAGWEQLSKNPQKMQEVFESMKDPEVMAKAQEMLKDPQYMAAARKKLAGRALPTMPTHRTTLHSLPTSHLTVWTCGWH